MILDASGKPAVIPPRRELTCPACGRTGQRQTMKLFGGYWITNCQCGHEYDRGRGEPPVQEV